MSNYYSGQDEEKDYMSGSASSAQGSSAPLPVFLQPTDLHFIVTKPETHKQVLTVYNPYEFGLRFTVLSNAPSRYRVVEPRGYVRPKCYVDIMIRHLSPTLSAAASNSDCLRIEIYREGDVVSCGRKDVLLSVLASDPSLSRHMEQDQFKAFPGGGGGLDRQTSSSSTSRSTTSRHVTFAAGGATAAGVHPPPIVHNFHWLVVLGFFTCILTLLLPAHVMESAARCSNEVDPPPPDGARGWTGLGSLIPVYIRPSSTLQLVAAYVLGLLTVYLIQPNQ